MKRVIYDSLDRPWEAVKATIGNYPRRWWVRPFENPNGRKMCGATVAERDVLLDNVTTSQYENWGNDR